MKRTPEFYELFIADVIFNNKLTIEIPSLSSKRLTEAISPLLKSEESGPALVGSVLAGYLVDACESSGDYGELLKLAEDITEALNDGSRGDMIRVASQQARASLFWAHVVTRGANIKFLNASSSLMAAICQGSYQEIRAADSAMAQMIWASGTKLSA